MAKLKELSDKVGSGKLVTAARKLLSDGVYDVAVNQAHDTSAADRARDEAIELILELQKATK